MPTLRRRSAPLLLVILAAAALGFTAVTFGWLPAPLRPESVPTQAPATTKQERPTPDPPYVAEGTAETKDQVMQVAYDVCPQALDVGSCLDYTVTVTSMDGATGEVEVSWARSAEGQAAAPLSATGITIDESLVGEDRQYIAYVAAHEWNHIEQINVAGTVGGRDAMRTGAHDYYADRAPGGLSDETLGMEVLADCMTVMGDSVHAGEARAGAYYLQTYAGGEDPAEMCGDWWLLLSEVASPS